MGIIPQKQRNVYSRIRFFCSSLSFLHATGADSSRRFRSGGFLCCIMIKKNSEIKSEKLPNGYYLNSAVISDFRGDVYYSQVVGNKVSGGKVSERNVDAAFQGRDY